MDEAVRRSKEVFDGERSHLLRLWPDRPHEEFTWTLGPISMMLPRFRVRRIAPVEPRDPWIYVSVGAWEATLDQHHGTKFFLLSATENPLHVELLAMVTHLHADPRYRLKVGSTIDIGRPWTAGAAADHLLVSLAYPYGPSMEWCELGEYHVRFLWLVPVTAAEADLVRTHGLEILEQRLEENNVDVIAPDRPSLA